MVATATPLVVEATEVAEVEVVPPLSWSAGLWRLLLGVGVGVGVGVSPRPA